MKELRLSPDLQERLGMLYRKMEDEYDTVAKELDFTCEGCPDNCCDSHFKHHTYAEWAYLRLGLEDLPDEKKAEIEQRAADCIKACAVAEARGERPQVMCPLNENGLCILYKHRMLVCRTHGVPASMMRPDGKELTFPGCFRCQELVERREKDGENVPRVERTPLLRQLVEVENELLHFRRHVYPKVNLTISEMIIKGPPTISSLHCEG